MQFTLSPRKFLVSLIRFSALFGFCAGMAAHAESLFVDSPKALNEAIALVQAGDEIVMRDGTWRDLPIRFKGSGTESAPIVLRAETSGQVRLTGRSMLRMAGSWLEVRGLVFTDGSTEGADVIEFRFSSSEFAQHSRLVDCAIIDYNPRSDRSYKWVSVYGQDNAVENCHFSGKTNQGTLLTVWLDAAQSPNRTIIRGNYFGPRPSSNGKNEYETIRIGTSGTSHLDSMALVEGNYFEACNGEIEVISNKSCGNIYRNNVFDRCEGQLTLRHGNDCLIEGNAFYGASLDRTGGVRVIGSGHVVRQNYFQGLRGEELRAVISLMSGEERPKPSGYFPVVEAEVRDNVIVNCELAFGIGSNSSSKPTVLPPAHSIIAGNRIFGGRGDLIEFYRESPELRFEANQVSGYTLPEVEGFVAVPDTDGSLKAAAMKPKPDRQNYGPSWIR